MERRSVRRWPVRRALLSTSPAGDSITGGWASVKG
jgi:hypothetical protein